MNTKKQQCIKDAYLKLISEEEFNKLDLDSEAWLPSSEFLLLGIRGPLLDFKEQGKQLMARPKSLQGIENNNNWISIESEADLPKEFDRGKIKLNYWTNGGFYNSEDYKRWKLHYDHLQITHYQLIPIESPKQPHY